jgi:hypothetical protein
MSSSQVNINNLRSYLTKILANQARTATTSYSNQVALVTAVAIASTSVNLNPKTGTITVTGTTGSIVVSQPIINPLPVNTTTSFISTANNQVSVTSQGEENTIITSKSLTIQTIEDVTNNGYTKNNSVSNLYDFISSNYWNPQNNYYIVFYYEPVMKPFEYKLNYTFSQTGTVYKLVTKNNNNFPGYKSIKVYSIDNPSNYVILTPTTDINDEYSNQSVYLLIDDNGDPLFDSKQLSLEFDLTPYRVKDNQYQIGGAYGILYDNNIVLRSGSYFFKNSSTGSRNEWIVSEFANNTSTNTGTITINNNFISSKSGQYQILWNTLNYSPSSDYGNNFNNYTFETDQNYNVTNVNITNDGKYITLFAPRKNGSDPYLSNSYWSSSDYGVSYNSITNGDVPYTVVNQPNYLKSAIDFSISISYTYIKFIDFLNDTDVNIPINFIYFPSSSPAGDINTFNFTHSEYPYPLYKKTLDLFVSNNGDNLYIINVFAYDVNYYTKFGIIVPKLPGNNTYGFSYFFEKTSSDNNFTQNISPFLPNDNNYLICFGQNQNSITPTLDGKYKTGMTRYSFYSAYIYYSNDYGVTYNYVQVNLPIEYFVYGKYYFSSYINESKIYISSSGQYQIVYLDMIYDDYIGDKYNPSLDICKVLYSNDYGHTWNTSNSNLTLNRITNISSNDDFSLITINGGIKYIHQGVNRTDPINYISTDMGATWTLSCSINVATELTSTVFYTAQLNTNKTYFQIKDLNQNQVLGVSDNGFKMTKDLRVTNSNAYIIGGNMTIGPDEASALLNDYELNVDGTTSSKNFLVLSDERLKNIIGKYDDNDPLDKINKLECVKYKYKYSSNSKENIGLIAQKVKQIIPEVVDLTSGKLVIDGEEMIIDDIHTINYNSLLCYLIYAFQKTTKEIETLKQELIILKK